MKFIISAMFAMLLMACTQPTPLQSSMEQMAKSYKVLKRAQTVEQMKPALAEFKQGLALAQQQTIPTAEQAKYKEGLEEIAVHVERLENLFVDGDIELIKAELKALIETKDLYHEQVIKQKH
ncbi:hypothetical protein HR060_06935 [Catenovulum sp. SM1970]|uniref:cytochrome b562 n=1 Tax=Marinifaba aquimaris TaxID=2741323 RepID=UPI00157361B0|nr:cytochrome b562 [Marinifaba aquimaris]NTS76602.1 hypothetical protein [Marinifaba aquimaris]